ncbi:hypothetical protein [Pedobacter punctiformis]|uniref:Right handed beta helix domain-containing protein n=1 Tax=Pedobacter punctiformis TaxID=3004097 RepID=A0ABT4L6Y9_9SPHI|nr:hypothetical protein [Pedobacter sp. HCMS5-2]MCZ4242898.1 hypothetical protein [Pedobacter sp. HCMS5-2]
MRLLICGLLIISSFLLACRKDERITSDPNARLSFSKDSVFFDTVFTSTGSTTSRIKILNLNPDALNVSEIKLAGGASSSFNININGENTNQKANLIINGKDSINLFVKVTINPSTANLPFLVQDSIILNSNGNRQVIQLLAYGQNAVFVNNAVINTNATWAGALPYVVNNTLTVKSGSTLTIAPGTKVFFHKDAGMHIEGSLNAAGTLNNPILFCSDRLEDNYSDEPGQWKGLYLKNGGNALIKNAVIKNASVGITSDSLAVNATPKLILSNSIIKNMQVAAYIGYHSELIAFNNLMYNCGNYLIYGIGGGNYNLKQNTLVGYNPGFPRKTAALTFSDYLSASAYNKMKIDLINNLIWGSLVNELDVQQKSKTIIQTNISNNLIKTGNTSYNTNANILNADPLFISTAANDFQLSSASPALKKGVNLASDAYFSLYLNKDLKNKARIFPSSLGCYENY